MGQSWVSISALTGEIIADLPYLQIETVKQTIGRYETASARLPIATDDAPADWQRATRKGAAFLVCLEDNPDDPAHGIPVWGGLVTRRRRNGSDKVDIDLVTGEGYFDRVYVGDQTFSGVGQNTILQTLLEAYAKTGAKPALPLRVQITAGGAGTLRDRTYLDADDKTLYSVMQEALGVTGGPEWTVGWEWQTGPERITPVAYVGDRIGVAPLAGLAPGATFDLPGCLKDFDEIEDFGTGKGATDVMAVSSGEGSVRPQSSHAVSTDTTRPRFEHRWTPSTSITNIATLDSHAQRALSVMKDGSVAIALIATEELAPRLGIDWRIGDDVAYDIGGLVDGVETVPAFPGGLRGIARAVGWERRFGGDPTITPIVILPTGVVDA